MNCLNPFAALKHGIPARVASTLLVLLALAAPSWAVPMIDFVVTPETGIVAYDGTGGPMAGANIGISFVLGVDTPSAFNGIPYACIDCVLTFVTGPLISAVPNAWVFSAGPTSGITISGAVDITGDGVGDIVGNLLAGRFVGPTVTVDYLPGDELALGLTAGAFLDIKNPLLAALYGLPAFPFDGDLTLVWAGRGESPSGFIGQARQGVVRNAYVPEPGTILLLGFGVVGLLRSRRTFSS